MKLRENRSVVHIVSYSMFSFSEPNKFNKKNKLFYLSITLALGIKSVNNPNTYLRPLQCTQYC